MESADSDVRRSRRKLSRAAIGFARRHPLLALRLSLGLTSYEDVQKRLVVRNLQELRERYSELHAGGIDFSTLREDQIQRELTLVSPSKRETPEGSFNEWYSFLYAATRWLRPEVVIETGVLYGRSSAAILQGMEDNTRGRLVSIELPVPMRQISDGKGGWTQTKTALTHASVGSAVPDQLRSRWDLLFGDSLEILPQVLVGMSEISMFIHDSFHTYEHMLAEFKIGYGKLEVGGLLVSDDLEYSGAWHDFCRLVGENGVEIKKGGTKGGLFGFVVKSRN